MELGRVYDPSHERLGRAPAGATGHTLANACPGIPLDLGHLGLCGTLEGQPQLFLWMGGAGIGPARLHARDRLDVRGMCPAPLRAADGPRLCFRAVRLPEIPSGRMRAIPPPWMVALV